MDQGRVGEIGVDDGVERGFEDETDSGEVMASDGEKKEEAYDDDEFEDESENSGEDVIGQDDVQCVEASAQLVAVASICGDAESVGLESAEPLLVEMEFEDLSGHDELNVDDGQEISDFDELRNEGIDEVEGKVQDPHTVDFAQNGVGGQNDAKKDAEDEIDQQDYTSNEDCANGLGDGKNSTNSSQIVENSSEFNEKVHQQNEDRESQSARDMYWPIEDEFSELEEKREISKSSHFRKESDLTIDIEKVLEPSAENNPNNDSFYELLIKQKESRVKDREEAILIHNKCPSPKPPFSPFSANSGSKKFDFPPKQDENQGKSSVSPFEHPGELSEKEIAAQNEIISAVKDAIESTHSKLYDAFLLMDKKKKGGLSQRELFDGLCKLRIGIAQSSLRSFVKSVPTNAENLISFQEFFKVFETGYVNRSKQNWSPPSARRSSFSPGNSEAMSPSLLDRQIDFGFTDRSPHSPHFLEGLNDSIISSSSATVPQKINYKSRLDAIPFASPSNNRDAELENLLLSSVDRNSSKHPESDSRNHFDQTVNNSIISDWDPEEEQSFPSPYSTQAHSLSPNKIYDASDRGSIPAPTYECARDATLSVKIGSVANWDLLVGSTMKLDDDICGIFCECWLGDERFDTSISDDVIEPLWSDSFEFGGTTTGLPTEAIDSILRIYVKIQNSEGDGILIGSISIPIWGILSASQTVVYENERSLQVLNWYPLDSVENDTHTISFHGPDDSTEENNPRIHIAMILSFPGLARERSQMIMSKSEVALHDRSISPPKTNLSNSVGHEPKSQQVQGVSMKSPPTSKLSLSSLASPPPTPPTESSSTDQSLGNVRNSGLGKVKKERKSRIPSLSPQREVLDTGYLARKKEQASRSTTSNVHFLERENALLQEKLKTSTFLLEQQKEKEQDLRAQLRLLNVQVERHESDREKGGEALEDALKRREEYQQQIHLLEKRIKDLEEIVADQNEKLAELRVFEENGQILLQRVAELEATLLDAKHVLEQNRDELESNDRAIKALSQEKLSLTTKLEQALSTNSELKSKLDFTESNAAHVYAAAGKRIETQSKQNEASESEQVRSLVETVTQLNRVIDQLREAEGVAVRQAQEANARTQEHASELAKLAAENEVQARELSKVSQESSKQADANRKAMLEINTLERTVQALRDDRERSETEIKLHRQESTRMKDSNLKLQSQVDYMNEQLTQSTEKFIALSSEIVELRKYRSGSYAHLHAQALTIERMRNQEKNSNLLRTLQHERWRKAWATQVFANVDQLKEDIDGLKGPLRKFKMFLDTAVDQVNHRLSHCGPSKEGDLMGLQANKPNVNDEITKVRESAQRSANVLSIGTPNGSLGRNDLYERPLDMSDMRKSYELEKNRRRSLHTTLTSHGVRSVCSVFRRGNRKSMLLSSGSPSFASSPGNRWNRNDAIEAEPVLSTNELMVGGHFVNRFFGFDRVILEDVVPDTGGGKASLPAERYRNSMNEHILPLVDSLFDGDRSLVVTSGEGADFTTDMIVKSIFDSIEQLTNDQQDQSKLGHRANMESSADDIALIPPTISIACVDVYNNNVFDMLGNGDNNFEKIPFDRVAARATGRVNLEGAGLTVVEVRSRYQAGMVIAMGLGNRAAACASRRISESSSRKVLESHLVFTIWVDSTDPFTSQISQGKMHIVQVSSSPNEDDDDDGSVESLAQLLASLPGGSTAPPTGSSTPTGLDGSKGFQPNRSPGLLSRLFCNSVLLGIIKDCVDEDSLGTSALSRAFLFGFGGKDSRMPLYHVLVHPTFALSDTRSGETLTALRFAKRLRTETITSAMHPQRESPSEDDFPLSKGPFKGDRRENVASRRLENDLFRPEKFEDVGLKNRTSRLREKDRQRKTETDDRVEDDKGSKSVFDFESRKRSNSSGPPQARQRQLKSGWSSKEYGFDDDNRELLVDSLPASPERYRTRSRKPMRDDTPLSTASNRERYSHASLSPEHQGINRRRASSAESSRARKHVLDVLISHDDPGLLYTLFISMDKGRSGSLSRSEFRAGLNKIDPNLSKREVDLFIESMDQKRDGRIDFQEFFRVLGDARSGNQHQIFVDNKNAHKIAMRQRKKIREQLSPENRGRLVSSFEAFSNSTPLPQQQHRPYEEEHARIITNRDYFLGYTPPVDFKRTLRR